MQSETTEELPTLTREEKWRVYDAYWKKRKYDSDPEFREKTRMRALASYYRRKQQVQTTA